MVRHVWVIAYISSRRLHAWIPRVHQFAQAEACGSGLVDRAPNRRVRRADQRFQKTRRAVPTLLSCFVPLPLIRIGIGYGWLFWMTCLYPMKNPADAIVM
jgi:hypothetical protein